jgi:F0F1-type ATP synthase assembly protein I
MIPNNQPEVMRLAGLGLQFAVTVLAAVFLGRYLDGKFDLSPWLTVLGALLGLFLGLYSFLL